MWRAEAAGRDWPQSAPRTWSIAWTCLEPVWGNVCCHHGVLSPPSLKQAINILGKFHDLRTRLSLLPSDILQFCVRAWTDTIITSP